MSDPTPNQPDPSRPVAKPPGPSRPVPMARRLDREENAGKTVAKNDDAAPPKSSLVISKTYRVRELPPPPVVAPPKIDGQEAEARDILPDGLMVSPKSPPQVPAEPPIELAELQIRPAQSWRILPHRIRIPARWQQWAADPQRREKVGAVASLAIHAAFIVLAAVVLRGPPPATVAEPIQARTIEPVAAESPPRQSMESPSCEPLVRQLAAGALEAVTLDPPEEDPTGIADSRSHAGDGSQPPEPRVGPPVKVVDDAADRSNQAHPTPRTDAPASSAEGPLPGMAEGSQLPPDLLEAIDALMQGKFQRRTPNGRGEGIHYGGGTPQSEEAVQRALHWLVIHQRENGSWNFNHLSDACQHYCSHPGSEASTTAATGLALLPFLGAGYTHKSGEFQAAIARGLEYLKSRGIKISYGYDLRDGSMYGHALATIALCEAYGMTKDEDLREAAQGGLDFIAYAQDNHTGGWRYNPGEPGDTTVTGWMLMALKSGQMARLSVQSPAIFGAERFLNSVQNEDGSQYGYQSRKSRPTTTAVGLLCRMYTGWRRDNPGLVKGVAQLSAWGPSKNDLYFDYYATQVLFHWAGPQWAPWNHKMRDYLISSQDRAGHSAGSWYFESQQSAAGGRLYNTALATMILEVYYRFMPLYGEEAVTNSGPNRP